ncbi:hypothetical protein [Ureaplasma zalophigenitalium]|uniref:Iron ABC transporter substrate-binding protein n=1 Tax=Ureaplasma zalophigenitalium TaxID=907723 RepID=A0ABT3BP50_9BACT|nr:hypothetical protein [Ureaplasma zalophigenitalium]MCV3753798.1 hypothetical protein [Ureaplasma zalophigenitalium]
MKKGILITTAVLTAVAAITTTTTFVVLKSKAKNYAKILDPEQVNKPLTLTSLKNTSATLHDLILGTKKINNGNYILYIGTQANLQHNNFIYDNDANKISHVESLKNNPHLKFEGALAKVLKNLQKYNNEYQNPPEIVCLIDVINEEVFAQQEAYLKEYNKFSQSSIANEKRWANNASSSYVFDPQASYMDVNNKKVFYRSDNQAKMMRETMEYLKNFIGADKIADLNTPTAPGIILFYKENEKMPLVYNFSKPQQNSQNPQNPQQPNNYPDGAMPWNSSNDAFGGQFNAAVGAIYHKDI